MVSQRLSNAVATVTFYRCRKLFESRGVQSLENLKNMTGEKFVLLGCVVQGFSSVRSLGREGADEGAR